MRLLSIFIYLIIGFAGGAVFAEGRGDSVAVVYNTAWAESKEVADHYAAMRHVPQDQVIGLKMTTNEIMTRAEYRDQLENPLTKVLGERQLLVFEPDSASTNAGARRLKAAKIRYVVLCYGVPLKIENDGSLKEPGAEKLQEALRNNEAAVDSELSLLPWPEPHRMLAGVIYNPFLGATNGAVLNPANRILIVARLDGPDAATAKGLVDKAMAAETNGLWGRAYFDQRILPDDPSSKKGDGWMAAAAKATTQYGFDTVLDEKPATFSAGFPMSQIALYAGWYDPQVSGPFAQPTVEFMTGAFAYHLHSYSAYTLRTTNRYWCGPLLAKGVTATMGCVYEPYFDGTPNIEIFFTRWLAGFTFGEAAYASQPVLSWQTTVIGDPLYQPFGHDPKKLHEGLIARHNPLIEWSHLRILNLSLVHGVPPGKLVSYIQEIGATVWSAVLTEKLAELYQRSGQTDASLQALQQALKLNPSAQQIVRLTFKLGSKLIGAGREGEALTLYDDFLKKNPSYPDAPTLYQEMETLATKLHKKSDAQRYAGEAARLKTLPPPIK